MKMMAATKKSEQTIQDFQYCEVCRRHHSQGRKHVYSRTHRDNINAIINKYGKKVKAAKPVLKHPVVDSGVNEENFWCYFCGCEVKKHDTTAISTMKYGGFFRHLASQEHRQKTFSFWWDHRIEKSLKNSFLLTQEDYGRYKKRLVDAVATWDAAQQKISSEPEVSKSSDHSSQSLAPANLSELKTSSNLSEVQHQKVQRATRQVQELHRKTNSKAMYTIEAHGDNLTCIHLPKELGASGNVHTGATPPWLWKDNDDVTGASSSKQIGPTVEDLQKHKKQKTLPKGRVGANFDRGSSSSEEWLPSFGRVWQVGRRWKPWQQKRKGRTKASAAQSRPDYTDEANRP
ncbi:centrosomal AT-AC splicing factor-like [Branchiostoma lanceolatum]|uniref:centrosomal AT-AC splicing factor-like n=1 Tax=Branchiostoma lanceolatum TaxID=7740 RepID=UPI0034544A4C